MAIPADDPHRDQQTLTTGVPLESARAVVIIIHGRGGSAADALRLAHNLVPDEVCHLVPQAADNSWYPERFLVPTGANEPWLSSALGRMRRLIAQAVAAGVPRERVLIGGFSQGACLALETAARMGGRFGGVFALSGALIGPPDAARPADRALDGTPVFIACGDADAHIPITSVQESTRVLQALGAAVQERIYRGLGHIIVSDEIDHVTRLIRRALGQT